MSYQLPPVTWLRAFEAAARHCSFAAAANELNMTSAAISHQIRSLEKRLGFGLFERLPRGVRLTEMGAAYLPAVRRAFEDLSIATTGIFGSLGEKTLRIRLPISYAMLVLTPQLPSFKRDYPGIELQLCTTVWGDGLNQEAVDIDIRYGDGRWADLQVAPEQIASERSIIVCSPDYAKELGPNPTLDQLAQGRIVQIMGCEGLWHDMLRQEGVDVSVQPAGVKSDTSLVALEYAAAGHGAVLVLDAFAAPYLKSGRLIQPIASSLQTPQSHYLVRSPESQHKAEVLLFCDWLSARFGD